MSQDKRNLLPPARTRGDSAHVLTRAGLNLIPVVGGTAAEFFNAVIAPPLERRRYEWQERIAREVDVLRERVDSMQPEQLADNDAFVSAMLSASAVAAKTHSEEKLRALQNIVLNTALDPSYDESRATLYLALVERFTPLHIQLLKIMDEGFVWSNDDKRNLQDREIPGLLIANVGSYKSFKDLDRTLIELCLRELIETNLIHHWEIKSIVREEADGSFSCELEQWRGRSRGTMEVRHGVAITVDKVPGRLVTETTPMGKGFVRFLSDPEV